MTWQGKRALRYFEANLRHRWHDPRPHVTARGMVDQWWPQHPTMKAVCDYMRWKYGSDFNCKGQ